jgi:uncharacterized protein (DUF983 family)
MPPVLPADQADLPAGKPAGESSYPRPSLGALLVRALRLRCPVCGRGKVFRSLMGMNPRCDVCGLWFEPEPGYFLGSIYFNYFVTALIATAVYLAPMLAGGRSPLWLLIAVTIFCVLFPLVFFRYARCLWLGLDHYFSRLDPNETPPGRT